MWFDAYQKYASEYRDYKPSEKQQQPYQQLEEHIAVYKWDWQGWDHGSNWNQASDLESLRWFVATQAMNDGAACNNSEDRGWDTCEGVEELDLCWGLVKNYLCIVSEPELYTSDDVVQKRKTNRDEYEHLVLP